MAFNLMSCVSIRPPKLQDGSDLSGANEHGLGRRHGRAFGGKGDRVVRHAQTGGNDQAHGCGEDRRQHGCPWR
jgi:hypothetical protein